MEQEILIRTRTRRIGGSLVVTIPANVVKEKQLVEDQPVTITVDEQCTSYFGALKGIGSYNRKEDRARGQLDDD